MDRWFSLKKVFVLSLAGVLGLAACARDKVPPTVTATPAGGNFPSTQQVALASNEEGSKIYYTLDGTDPTATSQAYAGPIEIAQTATLKYIGIDKAGNASAPASQTYTIVPPDTTPPTVTAEPVGGTFDAEQTVTLTSDDPEATIYYTEDGTEPTDASPTVGGPITVAKTTSLKFFAKDKAGNASAVATEEYKIEVKKAAKGGKKK